MSKEEVLMFVLADARMRWEELGIPTLEQLEADIAAYREMEGKQVILEKEAYI